MEREAQGATRLVLRGVKTCGSVHSCPMCAATILRERAQEVTLALDAVGRRRSALVTFTLRHDREMKLAPLRKLEAAAYAELKAGRAGAEFKERLGYAGDVKAAEQTWGEDNGWHPHMHALWVFESMGWAHPLRVDLQRVITERWRRCLVNAHARMVDTCRWLISNDGPIADRRRAAGERYKPGDVGTPAQRLFALKVFGARYLDKSSSLVEAARWFRNDLATLGSPEDFLPDFEHGVQLELVPERAEDRDNMARYLSKLGLELSGIAHKTSPAGHFTSWDIARRAADGDARFVELWKEHSRAMKGARQLTWSRGLREMLGMRTERSDAELSSEPLEPLELERLLGTIEGALWDQRVRHSGQRAVAELFEAYAAQAVRSHELVQPREGVRTIEPRRAVALTWWERWRVDAESRARGAGKLPPPPKPKRVKVSGAGYMQRHADALEDLRHWLYLEHGVA